MTEQEILISFVADKIRQTENAYMMTNTGFLSESEASAAVLYCRREGARFVRYGGFREAERTVLLLLPDYLEPETILENFAADPESDPLAVLRCHAVTGVGSRTLTHRDYLGSLLSLGIRRDVIGDILVREDGADILILKTIVEYLLLNYQSAGHTTLKVEIVNPSRVIVPPHLTEEIRDSVASERLDALLSAAFSISRNEAAEAIAKGLVFVNGIEATKPDAHVAVGETLVLRGHGKAVFEEIAGTTRKGRLAVVFRRYV